MRPVAFAALAALALRAAAQEAPPPAAAAPAEEPGPAAAPAAEPGPAPAPEPPPAQPRRSRWYLGFGVGAGSGRFQRDATSTSFARFVHPGEAMPLSLGFRVGATVTPALLVGLDVSSLGAVGQASVGGGTVRRSVRVTSYLAVATWFPSERGLFLRGGAGLASFAARATDPGSASRESRGGFGLLAGGGYALWLGQSFNLALNLDLSIQGYANDPGMVRRSSALNVWLGFDWS